MATYTVGEDDVSGDLNASVVTVSAGTLEDAAGNAITDFLIPPGQNIADLNGGSNRVIDGIRPTISSVTTSVGSGTYIIGETIDIIVTFDQPVTTAGGGDLVVTMETGATDQPVVISGVVSSLTAEGDYVVQAGDNTPLLDVQSIAMSAGLLESDNGNAVTDFSISTILSASKSIVIDGIAPSITDVSALNASGTYNADSTIKVIVTFDDNVTVAGGTPQLKMNIAGGYLVSLSGGGGSSILQFNYTPASPGHNTPDLDYFDANAFVLTTSTVKDANGNDADITLPVPGDPNSLGDNKDIVIDTIEPTVTDVTATTADGTYGVGAGITIQVVFSENVLVTGSPILALETGNLDATASYTGGTGTTTLEFSYTVGAGETSDDLDYQDSNALTLNGGTIADDAGNAANRTLDTPGDLGSLGANKDIEIDTTPIVANVTSPASNVGYYIEGNTILVAVTFDQTVWVTGTPQLTLETGTSDAPPESYSPRYNTPRWTQ